MPLQRWIKVKGKPGIAVSNPWALGANPPRYAGKRRDAALDGEHEHLDRYKDVEELLLQHADLLKACTKGNLVLLGQCAASTAEDAEKLLSAPAMPSKTKNA